MDAEGGMFLVLPLETSSIDTDKKAVAQALNSIRLKPLRAST